MTLRIMARAFDRDMHPWVPLIVFYPKPSDFHPARGEPFQMVQAHVMLAMWREAERDMMAGRVTQGLATIAHVRAQLINRTMGLGDFAAMLAVCPCREHDA